MKSFKKETPHQLFSQLYQKPPRGWGWGSPEGLPDIFRQDIIAGPHGKFLYPLEISSVPT